MSKICCICKEEKDYSEFHKNKAQKDGHQSMCIECRLKYDALDRLKPHSIRFKQNFHLVKKYGITYDQKQKMVEDQKGKCKVCDTDLGSLPVSKVCVDHCHETGAVRAVLCENCNISLGRLKEDPEIIFKLAQYAQWCKSIKE